MERNCDILADVDIMQMQAGMLHAYIVLEWACTDVHLTAQEAPYYELTLFIIIFYSQNQPIWITSLHIIHVNSFHSIRSYHTPMSILSFRCLNSETRMPPSGLQPIVCCKLFPCVCVEKNVKKGRK